MKKWILKNRLKKRYKKLYLQIQNYDDYNCGHKMMLYASSDYYNLVESFNEVADKLSEIDKDCPTFRYKLN